MQDDSILVILETETKKYKVKAIVPGKLICINKVITEDSQKIVTHHDSLGHIAILLPTKGQYEAAKAKLLSQEEYAKRIREEETGAGPGREGLQRIQPVEIDLNIHCELVRHRL